MRSVVVLLLLSSCFLGLLAGDLKGWKVVQANIATREALLDIAGWDLDVWSHDSHLIIGLNDIRVNDAHLEKLTQLGVGYDVIVDDVESMLEKAAKEYVNETAADWFASYHTLSDFNNFYNNLTSTYPALIKQTTIGQSIQNNNINAVVVTGTATGAKKKIMLTGLQHAREWISPHTVAYIVNQLVTLYNTDPTVKSIMDKVEFHVITIVNPDGYLYTWAGASQRLWRKNRRANTGGTYGVDLNRNWNDHWGGEGSSGTPSSDTYRGTAPFSEPETKATSAYILANRPFGGYIDFHAYGQLILRPYGWTRTLPPDSAVQKTVGDQMRSQILAVNKVSYTSEPANQLYITSGSSDDWCYTEGAVRLSYTIELRDTGSYGFQLPPAQIIPTGQEIWAAVKYFANYIISN